MNRRTPRSADIFQLESSARISIPGHYKEIVSTRHAPAWIARTMQSEYAKLQLCQLSKMLEDKHGVHVNFGPCNGPYDSQKLLQEKKAYEVVIKEALAMRKKREPRRGRAHQSYHLAFASFSTRRLTWE